MTDPAEPTVIAWQPLTPRGVLAFARAPWMCLFVVQFVFAFVAAVALVWFLRSAWFPTVRQAISQLPDQGEMQSGKLNWTGGSPMLLAEGHFLAFVVDTNHSGTLRSPAQIQVEFGRNDIYFYSLAGYREWPYPPDWNFGFNHTDAQAWWGAWAPPIQWLAFGGMLAWCLAGWMGLATIYFLPVWLAALFANRDLKLGQCWKLAGAALMPGAVLMILTIFSYGFGLLDLVQLSVITGLHIILGWVYLVWCVRISPKVAAAAAPSENPFVSRMAQSKNPFASKAPKEAPSVQHPSSREAPASKLQNPPAR